MMDDNAEDALLLKTWKAAFSDVAAASSSSLMDTSGDAQDSNFMGMSKPLWKLVCEYCACPGTIGWTGAMCTWMHQRVGASWPLLDMLALSFPSNKVEQWFEMLDEMHAWTYELWMNRQQKQGALSSMDTWVPVLQWQVGRLAHATPRDRSKSPWFRSIADSVQVLYMLLQGGAHRLAETFLRLYPAGSTRVQLALGTLQHHQWTEEASWTILLAAIKTVLPIEKEKKETKSPAVSGYWSNTVNKLERPVLFHVPTITALLERGMLNEDKLTELVLLARPTTAELDLLQGALVVQPLVAWRSKYEETMTADVLQWFWNHFPTWKMPLGWLFVLPDLIPQLVTPENVHRFAPLSMDEGRGPSDDKAYLTHQQVVGYCWPLAKRYGAKDAQIEAMVMFLVEFGLARVEPSIVRLQGLWENTASIGAMTQARMVVRDTWMNVPTRPRQAIASTTTLKRTRAVFEAAPVQTLSSSMAAALFGQADAFPMPKRAKWSHES